MLNSNLPGLMCIALTLLLALNQMASRSPVYAETKQTAQKESPELKELRRIAFQLYSNQKFEEAIQTYKQARELALREGNPSLAVHFLNNIASSHFSMASYQKAMQYYSQAAEEANAKGLKEIEVMAIYNLASIQLSLGQEREALALIQRFPLDGKGIRSDARLDAFLLQGNVFTRLKKDNEAKAAFDRALEEADQEIPENIKAANAQKLQKWPESVRELRRAWVFAVIGQALAWREKYEASEAYILDSFRLRSTFQEKARLRDALQLAIVLRARGDFEGALKLVEIARRLDPTNRTPMHSFMFDREEARIYLSQNQASRALPLLRSALAQARDWRLQVLPSDSSYLNFESYLTTEVHKEFLGTIAASEADLGNVELARESFWVAEEARFASMRATQLPSKDFASRFKPSYWQKLAQYHALQADSIRGNRSNANSWRALELELSRLEWEAGLSIPTTKTNVNNSVQDLQQKLKSDELIFSYYLAEPYSIAWTVSKTAISARRIAGRKQLGQWIETFNKELLGNYQIGNSSTGMKLSKQLFGDHLSAVRTIPFWTMVLDQELLSLPIAALPSGDSASPFLVEKHCIRNVPAALYLGSNPSGRWNLNVVGIGDPIYNQADPRLQQSKDGVEDLLQLNRLPMAGKELEESLQLLAGQKWSTSKFTALSATPEALQTSLQSSPDVIHISAHFLSDPERPQTVSIALSPSRTQKQHSLFNPLDLNALRTETKLVVLSGCSSSAGQMIPSLGMNGLSRAFLIAGATTVVATLWPVQDTQGGVFPEFYTNLNKQPWSGRAAAIALQAAQVQMIRGGGWTSRPSYWAAYVAISKG